MLVEYCTYFDHNYLPRGLALFESLQAHAPGTRLWVLCMTPECHQALRHMALPNLRPIPIESFEAEEPAIVAVKPLRTTIEYYFTCSPALPLYVLRHAPDATHVTYLDADMFFFASPDSAYAELGDASIGMVGHRFPARLFEHEKWGKFNVGWLTFRRDEQGLACLNWWRERCIEWCHDELLEDRFADQKYLERWPALFSGLKILVHPGINVAPYNLELAHIERDSSGALTSNGQPLVIFHFHGFQRRSEWVFDPNLRQYAMRADAFIRRAVFAPYIQALERGYATARMLMPDLMLQQTIRQRMRRQAWRTGLNLHGRIVTEVVHAYQAVQQVLRGQLLIRLGGRVL